MIILCPNHHTLFDVGALTIDLEKRELIHADPGDPLCGTKINLRHELGEEYVQYHNQHIFKGRL
ncbi:MAG: hypothetical protein GXX09_02465 [Syntrophomonadaceae bacterium]|nr:hypothetical protein [Syntrophomonadaceae bacterium]